MGSPAKSLAPSVATPQPQALDRPPVASEPMPIKLSVSMRLRALNPSKTWAWVGVFSLGDTASSWCKAWKFSPIIHFH
ncbi:hypothetical protein D3C84_1031460 [compost metagenome]